ncbi:MAG: hypothetical protein R3330_13245 [Saprospiraceae bacterium]|nr:hypothetical protein [Saprospiraceae bacterium]
MSDHSLPTSENKRRSWTISLIIHAGLLLLALIPFLVTDNTPREFTRAIAIQFNQDDASKRSGSSQSARAGSEGASRSQVALATLKPAATSQSVPSSQQRDILTAPEPNLPVRPQSDSYFDDPLEVTEANEVDRIEALPEAPKQDDGFSDWEVPANEAPAENASKISFDDLQSGQGKGQSGTGNADNWNIDLDGVAESGTEDPFADGFFSGEWPGDGRGTQGRTEGVGTDGQSMRWGEFSDDGLFNRKVIHRANVARLAVSQGKIVIKLCVDRNGQVVWVKYDRDRSSLHNPDLISRAEATAEEYKFEKDPAAPTQQCGALTFIFQIET